MAYSPNVKAEINLDKTKRKYIPDRPVIVYRRDAANKLLAQGFRIISVEKNLKRDGDASIFLFDPENGKTLKALDKILIELKETKNDINRLIPQG